MKIALVSAAYPPDIDGIGDYTWWMAQSLASSGDIEQPVTVFTSDRAVWRADSGVEVVPCFDPDSQETFANLQSKLRGRDIDWLVLQYNPFSFGRRGFCPSVPTTIGRIRRSGGSPRIAVMFHETCVPSWPWKFAVMSLWQRPIFRRICQNANIAFVSTNRWTEQVNRASPLLPCEHLSVGATVPLCDILPEEARRELGIRAGSLVLGVFGSGHVSRRLTWITNTAKAVEAEHPETILLYVGADGAAIRDLCGNVELVDAGVQPMERVGLYLRAMDLLLAPFADGISTRRTSVMAPLQHGIPVATTRSANSDAVFRSARIDGLLISDAETCSVFVGEVLGWLRIRRWKPSVPNADVARFYVQEFSWSRLVDVMVAQLEHQEAAT